MTINCWTGKCSYRSEKTSPQVFYNLLSLQALNGFLMILDCNGELFFATHSIETYLGFHQVSAPERWSPTTNISFIIHPGQASVYICLLRAINSLKLRKKIWNINRIYSLESIPWECKIAGPVSVEVGILTKPVLILVDYLRRRMGPVVTFLHNWSAQPTSNNTLEN